MRDGSGGSVADDDAGDDAGALPRRLIEQCLCRSEGSVWGVLGVTDEQMKEHLHMRAAANCEQASREGYPWRGNQPRGDPKRPGPWVGT